MARHTERLKGIQERHPLDHPDSIHRRRLTRMDKTALWFTELTGDVRFFAFLGVVILLWIAWNVSAPKGWRFDAFPTFLILLGATKLLQLCFMPLIMVGQHLQSKHARAQSDAAHRAALRSAEETELILARISELEELIQSRTKGDHPDAQPGNTAKGTPQ